MKVDDIKTLDIFWLTVMYEAELQYDREALYFSECVRLNDKKHQKTAHELLVGLTILKINWNTKYNSLTNRIKTWSWKAKFEIPNTTAS